MGVFGCWWVCGLRPQSEIHWVISQGNNFCLIWLWNEQSSWVWSKKQGKVIPVRGWWELKRLVVSSHSHQGNRNILLSIGFFPEWEVVATLSPEFRLEMDCIKRQKECLKKQYGFIKSIFPDQKSQKLWSHERNPIERILVCHTWLTFSGIIRGWPIKFLATWILSIHYCLLC